MVPRGAKPGQSTGQGAVTWYDCSNPTAGSPREKEDK